MPAAEAGRRSAGDERKGGDRLERLSRVATEGTFVVAIIAAVVAPILAVGWSHQPFPGFFVDPTLVVNDMGREARAGALADLRFPQRVTQISGQRVADAAAYDRALRAHAVGEEITVFAEAPDGTPRLYHPVRLTAFPSAALVWRFWLPYLVGLAYLAIGLWAYGVQGHTRPGRALSFFCASTAIVTLLVFDLTTSHVAPVVWTLAMAMAGGALVSLALRFPEEWRPVATRPWLLAGPYLLSAGLGLWGVLALSGPDRLAYVGAWGASYRYTALGILFFVAVMLYRSRRGRSALVRRQARVVLWGSLLAFAPITLWFVLPLVGRRTAFDAALLLPTLLLFPLAVGVAIVRYRLWQVDQIVNRALVYSVLTALLAGLYAASIGLSQRLFITLTGERSDAAIVLTTLVLTAAFTPLKGRVQALVDRVFADPLTSLGSLREFGDAVRAFFEMGDTAELRRRLLREVVESLDAESGALNLERDDGRLQTVATHGPWRGQAAVSMPLVGRKGRLGVLQLGPRADGRAYSGAEIDAAAAIVTDIVRVVRLPEEDAAVV